MSKDFLKYYSQQSPFTDPGKYSYLFKTLPRSISKLSKIIQGIIMHCDTASLYSIKLSNQQKQDRESRYAEKILSRIIKRDNRSLSIERKPSKRFAGNCRDFTLILCSILRYQGVPSRLRCGFTSYFTPNFYEDHWVCEYWNNKKNKWILVDAELDETIKKAYKIRIDSLDVSYDQFLLAGKAWQMCRSRKVDPNKFGVSEIDIKGVWFVRGSVLRDFVALNKIELMPWDYTKFSDKQFRSISELPREEMKLINSVADLIINAGKNFEKIRDLYKRDPRLQAKGVITSYTLKEPKKIQLRK